MLGGAVGELPRSAFAEGTEGSDVAATASVGAAEEPPLAVAREGGAGPVALKDMGLEVPYTGKSLPLNKFLGGKATLVVNPKIDDPESLHQVRWANVLWLIWEQILIGTIQFIFYAGKASSHTCGEMYLRSK